MSDSPIPVFVSVGRHYLPEETVLIERLFAQLRALGADPKTLPRDQWDYETPLRSISALMGQCRGVLVIAFSRLRYEAGYEWPDSARETPVGRRDVATVWLHIEAALAYALGLPTLILVERRLHPEGLLNPKHYEYRAVAYDVMECQSGLPPSLIESLHEFIRTLRATDSESDRTIG